MEIGVNLWDVDLDFEGHVMANIEDLEVPFLVDTGATLSLLNFEPKGCKASDKIMMRGVMGKGE